MPGYLSLPLRHGKECYKCNKYKRLRHFFRPTQTICIQCVEDSRGTWNWESYRTYGDTPHRAPSLRHNGFSGWDWLYLRRSYGFRCLACWRKESDDFWLTPDHVIPLSLGGAGTIDNIQPLCKSCNSRKGRKTTDYRPPIRRAA